VWLWWLFRNAPTLWLNKQVDTSLHAAPAGEYLYAELNPQFIKHPNFVNK